MKCSICGKIVPGKERPGAKVYHMQCARDAAVEMREQVKAGWPARAETGKESWVKEG